MKYKILHRKLNLLFVTCIALLMSTVVVSAQNTSPLCFTARNDSVSVRFDIRNVTHTIQYSTNGTSWNTYSSNTNVTIGANQSIYFMAATNQTSATAFGCNDYSSCSRFYFASSNGGTVEGSGNIMSLYGSTCPNLPLQQFAFRCMFEVCTLLTTPPALPDTTLANYCYWSMFSGCSSLTTAPALPASTLAFKCYFQMFSGCSSLTTAPALPATALDDFCYSEMFYGCSSLTTAPALPATALTNNCYSKMFYNCSSLRINTSGPGMPWIIQTTSTVYFALTDMFAGTGGTMNGTPSVNTTYYIPFIYYIDADANDSAWGGVSGSGAYYNGDDAVLTATPIQHYHFARWSDGNTTNPRFVTVACDSSFIAVFEPDKHNVFVNATNGTAEGSGEYDFGVIVKLTAIPDDHYCGAIWWDGDSSMVKNITLLSDTTLSLSFTKCKYVISASCEHGTIHGNGVYEFEDIVTLYVIPDDGYNFIAWSDSNYYNPRVFVIDENMSLEAICEKIPQTELEETKVDSPQFYVIANTIYNPTNERLKLFSASGKLLKQADTNIELSGYPAGVYIVVNQNGHSSKVLLR